MVSPPLPVQMVSLQANHPRASSLDIQNFKLSASEKFAFAQLRKEMDTYILQEYTQSCNDANIPILNIQDYRQWCPQSQQINPMWCIYEFLMPSQKVKTHSWRYCLTFTNVSLNDNKNNILLSLLMLNFMRFCSHLSMNMAQN